MSSSFRSETIRKVKEAAPERGRGVIAARPLTEVTAAVLPAVQATVPQAVRSEASVAVHSVAEALPAAGDSNEKNRDLLYVSR